MRTIRDARPEDAQALAELWARYLLEHYELRDKVTPDIVLRDGIGPARRIRFAVAVGAEGQLRGAVAWGPGYDLHHFVRGVDVFDLYVAPEHRGVAIAVQLLAHVARAGVAEGAQYMRGTAALEPTPGRRLYDRCVVYFDGTTANLSARAFRQLAALADASPREICRGVPERSWNYEP
jgi:ribosomal protein S18 acetylase RimI-like enzyme